MTLEGKAWDYAVSNDKLHDETWTINKNMRNYFALNARKTNEKLMGKQMGFSVN